MTLNAWIQLGVFLVVLLVLARHGRDAPLHAHASRALNDTDRRVKTEIKGINGV